MTPPTKAANPRSSMARPSIARIIPPIEHPITIEMLDNEALYILKKLRKAGFAGYLVGGGVRDLYLNKTPKDFDISTNARPGQIRKLFPHSNTIGRRFRLVQVFFRNGKTIEVSTLRSLSEHDLDGPEAVLASDNTFGTLSEDARRRDLTINSLFYEIENNTIIDYVDGSRDLDLAIIRIVGEPQKRISRDPVRMMRAIRHAAQNNFTIESKSWEAICRNAKMLSLCPPSRLRDEFLKDMYSGFATPWFELAINSNIFFALFPFYRNICKKKSSALKNPKEMLTDIFLAIDRINTISLSLKIHRQPNFLFMALLLTPWVEYHFQLFSHHRKNAQLFQLSKRIREQIDRTIGVNLNLCRSMRQEMVSLLTNLAQLIYSRQDNDWPKWLKEKSYFKISSFFYYLYMEVTTGITVEDRLLRGVSPPHFPAESNKRLGKKQTSPRSKPILSPKVKGGIFGLRK